MPRAEYLLLLISLTLVSACSDAPTALQTRPKELPSVAKDVSSYADGSLVTIVDVSGRALTLDISANEIRIDDGRVFLLTPDQTAIAATDFQNTVIYDGLATEVQTAVDHQVCHDTGGCLGEMTRTLPTMKFPLGRTKSGTLKSGQGGKRSTSPMLELNVPTIMSKNGNISGLASPVFDYLSILPDCQSMKEDILASRANYLNGRAAANARLLDQGLSGFVYQSGRFVKDLSVPELMVIFAGMEADYAFKASAESQMDLMRVLYTSQGCGTITFAGAESWGYSFSTVNGRSLVCHFENWHISFDNGATWRAVWISVCAFSMT